MIYQVITLFAVLFSILTLLDLGKGETTKAFGDFSAFILLIIFIEIIHLTF